MMRLNFLFEHRFNKTIRCASYLTHLVQLQGQVQQQTGPEEEVRPQVQLG